MDDERQVIAEGTYGAGLSWTVWAQWQWSGDAWLEADDLLSMIRVISADGRVLHEGGGGGPALYPGQLMNVSTGGSDESPYCVLARVHPDIGRVELVTEAGEIMHVPVYDSARFPDVRFAALLVPRELNLDSVAGFSHGGEELERFDLTFHQRFWHQITPAVTRSGRCSHSRPASGLVGRHGYLCGAGEGVLQQHFRAWSPARPYSSAVRPMFWMESRTPGLSS